MNLNKIKESTKRVFVLEIMLQVYNDGEKMNH